MATETPFSASVDRAALGRSYGLGAMYNLYSDKFQDAKILQVEKLPKEAITIFKRPYADYQYISSDKISEKFDKLNVSVELQMSFMSGLITAGGSASYLNESKKSAQSLSATCIYNCLSEVHELNIYNDEFKAAVSLTALENEKDATHVVMKITYGGGAVCTAETTVKDEERKQEVGAKMNAAFKNIGTSVSASASTDLANTDKEIGTDIKIEVSGDFLLSGSAPQTFVAANELMKNIPKLIETSNDGKGVPVTYTLIPLVDLRRILKVGTPEQQEQFVLTNLPSYMVLDFAKYFEGVSSVTQQMQDLSDLAESYINSLTKAELADVRDHQNKFSLENIKLKQKLAELVPLIRQDKDGKTTKDLQTLFDSLKNSDYSIDKMNAYLDKTEPLRVRLNWHHKFRNHEVSIIGPEESLLAIKNKFKAVSAYVMFGSETLRRGDQARWFRGYQYLQGLVYENTKKTDKTICVYDDVEVNPQDDKKEGIVVYLDATRLKGKLASVDEKGNRYPWIDMDK